MFGTGRDFAIYLFCPGIRYLNKHRCVDNPDSVCVSGQSIPIEKRIGALLYIHIFFVVRAEEFQLGIVASPSCTEYQWATLIVL